MILLRPSGTAGTARSRCGSGLSPASGACPGISSGKDDVRAILDAADEDDASKLKSIRALVGEKKRKLKAIKAEAAADDSKVGAADELAGDKSAATAGTTAAADKKRD